MAAAAMGGWLTRNPVGGRSPFGWAPERRKKGRNRNGGLSAGPLRVKPQNHDAFGCLRNSRVLLVPFINLIRIKSR